MTLGSTMRDAREAVQLSLESLSESTSIRMGLLNEMENNNFLHCGGDTYARGHLRNIAVKIGIDPQILFNLYNQEHSTEHRAIQDLLVENSLMQLPKESKKISWKVPAAVSIAILLVLALVQIVTSNQVTTPAPTPSPTPSPTEVVATPSPTPVVSKTGGPVTLTLSAARGNSYIDIIVDGKKVEKGSIFQGESKTFNGVRVISIYLSNPAGLDVSLNGKQLAPLGGQNEEVRRTFR